MWEKDQEPSPKLVRSETHIFLAHDYYHYVTLVTAADREGEFADVLNPLIASINLR